MWYLYMNRPFAHLWKRGGKCGISMTIDIAEDQWKKQTNASRQMSNGTIKFQLLQINCTYFNNVGWKVGDGGTNDKHTAINSHPRINESRLGFSVVCLHNWTYNSSLNLKETSYQLVGVSVKQINIQNLLLLRQRWCDNINGYRI